MENPVPVSLAGVLDSNVNIVIQKLQNEFSSALRRYQECALQLKLDPENVILRQNVTESQRQVVAVSLKQKKFVTQFREKSQMTPKVAPSENTLVSAQSVAMENGVVSNGTPDGCCDHYTPPISPKPALIETSCQPVFPSDVMEQEEFLKGFGLITHACLKTQSETKRVERRRRTTANPKYNSNGFVDLSHISRRSRKLEEPDSMASSPKRMSLIASVKSKQSQPRCIICEQIGYNLTCERCQAQLHVDCIRVSGSRAPAPTRLQKCPRCIVAINESRRLQGSSSDSEELKFQKPLIPSAPIIPINLKKKSITAGSPEVSQQNSSADVKPSTKTKITKKLPATIPVKAVAHKTTGSLGKGTLPKAVVKKAGLKVTKIDSSGSLSNVELLQKPVLNSPFKTLTALTPKGAAAKSLQNKLEAGLPGSIMNGSQQVKHKKSKINGVKATTLSVTGNQSNNIPNGSSKTVKHKASPLNNINTNGNVNTSKPKFNVKSANRLPKFNADQQINVQKTILAMTAAAKSVMSSNGMKNIPVSLGLDLQLNGDKDHGTKQVNNSESNSASAPVLTLPKNPVNNVAVVSNESSCSSTSVDPIIASTPGINSNNSSVANSCSSFEFNNSQVVVEKQ